MRNFSSPYSWGAEGENRRVQPLLADRVGLKPRITEGYERATGPVAALLRARDERDFREWPSHIGRDAHLQARDLFRSPVGRRCPCRRSLKASRETLPLHRSRPVPGYGACRFRRACAVKRMAEAVSGILPREDKAIAIRLLNLSEPSASPSGTAVSTLMRKVPGLMLPSAPPMAALTNGGPLAETRRCISPLVFAVVIARFGRLLSALRAHGAVGADSQGS
jgi:hypothetical protein